MYVCLICLYAVAEGRSVTVSNVHRPTVYIDIMRFPFDAVTVIGVVYRIQVLQSRLIRYSSKAQRKVLLFSYYRSGSTLTGQLFNYNPSAFYWFEPLAAVSQRWGWVWDIIPPRNWYHFDNGTEKYVAYHYSRIIAITSLSIMKFNLQHLSLSFSLPFPPFSLPACPLLCVLVPPHTRAMGPAA